MCVRVYLPFFIHFYDAIIMFGESGWGKLVLVHFIQESIKVQSYGSK